MTSTSTPDSFFGATTVDLFALPAGSRVAVTYDENGARRPGRYHRIEGTVDYATPAESQSVTLHLSDVTRTRPDGETASRPSIALYNRNIIDIEPVREVS